ncbi:spindle pole body component 110-like isoform X2 [Pomacea canaliculata]|uniref:spindle pole body component 110-like isoform X2 n=1 Tax=Pomacea canaliculata TaxID=400727 RepID=UPI000D73C367|nr:spindle pole body component 110-like isoform X2 [Pomacea canaliculata]
MCADCKEGDAQRIRSSLQLPPSSARPLATRTNASGSSRESSSLASQRTQRASGGEEGSLACGGSLPSSEKRKPFSGNSAKKVRFSGRELTKVPVHKGDLRGFYLGRLAENPSHKTQLPEPFPSRDLIKDLIFGYRPLSEKCAGSSGGQVGGPGDSETGGIRFPGNDPRSKSSMAASGDKGKKSFELRMCKKVAELTQVVHMLFTRNHEKEVELEALKDAYESEISDVLADAQSRIARLEKQQEDALKERTGETDRIRKLLEGAFHEREEEFKRRQEESERQLQEERAECQNLRDMLIHAQRDIEKLRQSVADQLTGRAGEIARREQEMDRLHKQVAGLEQTLRDVRKDSGEALRDLQRSNDKLEKDVLQLHTSLDENQRGREQLAARNKQLEMDIKALKRDFNRRVAEIMNNQARMQKSAPPLSQDQNEELEKLRREVQRYRLELSNRDVNFNRMFTNKQPTYVNRSGGGVLKLYASQPTGNIQSNSNAITMKKEKTMLQGPVILFEEPSELPGDRQRPVSTPAVHAEHDSRLPSICSTPEANQRPGTKLAKPKPLPKEMLFGK